MDNFHTTQWIFVRHAPLDGQEGRYVGQLDLPAQPVPQGLMPRLRQHIPADAVWCCSPLSRTRAVVLALKGHQQPVEVGDFIEQDFGDWQGRTYNDVYRANPGLDWNDPAGIVPPEGESFADMVERVGAAMDRLGNHYAGHTLAVGAHAGTVRAALVHALGIDPALALRFEIAPLSLTRLVCVTQAAGAVWRVGCINQIFS